MILGMDHCGLPAQTEPGLTEAGFDPLTALEKWVEDGVAPDSVLATKADKDGNVLWTRLLCAFPKKRCIGERATPRTPPTIAASRVERRKMPSPRTQVAIALGFLNGRSCAAVDP